MEAFFYGAEDLPREPVKAAMEDYHDETGSGLTVLHRKNDQYLLVKHGPFGGEHDHYDKLEFSYACEGKNVSTDLGTTGYGARLHYDYFKNTVSHNTIVMDEENQTPACGRIRRFENSPEYALVDAETTWSKDYQVPDSFIIRQWSDEAYEGAYFRRQIIFSDDFIVDVETAVCPRPSFDVHGAERKYAAKAARPGTASRGKSLPCSIENPRQLYFLKRGGRKDYE